MKIIDLSHKIASDMPVYPGTEQPLITDAFSIDDAGFLERKIVLFSHTGTHMDAPGHLIQGAPTLDQMPMESFYGKGCVAHLTHLSGGESIDVKDLQPYEDKIAKVRFVLLRTGWSRYWGKKEYFSGYPVLTEQAAQWLCNFHLKGIGVDMISVDLSDSRLFPIHKILLSIPMLIVENLNLDAIGGTFFTFACFPLNLPDADGSPVRAVAIID